jgi:phosphomannomutase
MRFSRIVCSRLDGRNISHTSSRPGRLYLTNAMRDSGAMFGGEISGHYYWKEFGGMESPELTLLKLYKVIQQSGRTLSELVAPYSVYFKSDEISIPVRDRKHVSSMIEHLASHFPYGKQSRDEGLTVDYPDYWFNIRQSNTEPVMRLIVEAKTKNLLDQKVGEISGLVAR